MTETFARSADTPWDATNDAGVRRQVLGHGPDLMLVRVEFEAGAVGALHHHPHRQVSYVAAGRFEVTLGEERTELGPGDCFFVTANRVHGVRAYEAGTLIDVFTPAREDFLRASRRGS
jgi:quercetin dioxygenase-like cupin family protein